MTDKKNKVGRPPKLTQETINKLEEAFLVGANDMQACFYAGISDTALYNYQKKHPEYVYRKQALKQSLQLRAKHALAASIDSGDVNDAKWLLERKEKDEYSTATKTTLAGDAENPLLNKIQVELIAARKDTDTGEV